MSITYAQYQIRSKLLQEILVNYIDDSYIKPLTQEEIEDKAILTLPVIKQAHHKIAKFLREKLHCQVSIEELPGTSNGNNILLHICVDTDRFHRANLPHIQSAFEILALPKYLILDSQILRGKVMYPSDKDIVLESFDCGSVSVLENGYQTVEYLNELAAMGYEIVLLSQNPQRDQELFRSKLDLACQRHGVDFPKIHAMLVCDSTDGEISIAESSSKDVLVIKSHASLTTQESLEKALSISKTDRRFNIVFTENGSSFTFSEGYQIQLLANTEETSFDTLLKLVLENTRHQREQITAQLTDAPPYIAPATLLSIFPKPADVSSNDTDVEPAMHKESSLTPAQQTEIQAMIMGFKKKINSLFWTDKDRRRQKVAALEMLVTQCKTSEVADAVADVDKRYPNISHGKLRDLLRRLANESPSGTSDRITIR